MFFKCFQLFLCSRRRVKADVPGARRHHPTAIQAGAQPGRQQPRVPAEADRAPNTDVALRSRAAAQVFPP